MRCPRTLADKDWRRRLGAHRMSRRLFFLGMELSLRKLPDANPRVSAEAEAEAPPAPGTPSPHRQLQVPLSALISPSECRLKDPGPE